jgi:sugar/nucleoside kinase (ribokinase family)
VANHIEIARAIRRRQTKSVWIQIDSPWHDRTDPSQDHALGLFADIDAVLPSEVDVSLYRPHVPVEGVVLGLLEHGAKSIVLKLGPLGCQVYARGRGLIAEIPIVAVPTKDPTGAGDAFCGGFLAGMQISGDVATAARYGAVSASFAVQAYGLDGLSRSTRQEAQNRLASISP